jgi:hypothetical protein
MSGYQLRTASSVATLNDMNSFIIDIGADTSQAPPPRTPEPAHRPRRAPARTTSTALRTPRTPRAVEAAMVANMPIEAIADRPPASSSSAAASATSTATATTATGRLPTNEPPPMPTLGSATKMAPPPSAAAAAAATTVQSGNEYTDSVHILPRQYRDFRRAPADRYQNTIKPLTAPPLGPTPEMAATQLNLVRATQRLYFYNFQKLQAQDWYDFLFNEVIGRARRPENEFIQVHTLARPGGGDELMLPGANPTSRYGLTSFQTQQTPFGGSGGFGGGGGVPGAGGILQQGSFLPPAGPLFVPPPPPLPPPPPPPGSAPTPSAPPAMLDAFDMLHDEIADADPAGQTIASGNRYTQLQDDIDNLLAEQSAQDASVAKTPDELAQIRRARRRATHDAEPWLSDARQATGFVVLNPLYIAAKRQALARLRFYCRATSLATVEEEEFIRRRPRRTLPNGKLDVDWETARSMFGELIADFFVLNRMKAGAGVNNAGDKAYMTRQINALLSDFAYRIGYNDEWGYKTFYIIDPRNDERRQPVFARESELRFTPYESVLGPQYTGRREAASLAGGGRQRITLAMLGQ